jgi:hypothetical protein
MVSLTLSQLDFLHDVVGDLLEILGDRSDHDIGLERLVVQGCRVHTAADAVDFRELVGEVELIDVKEMGSDYKGSDEDSDPDLNMYRCRGMPCRGDFY